MKRGGKYLLFYKMYLFTTIEDKEDYSVNFFLFFGDTGNDLSLTFEIYSQILALTLHVFDDLGNK